MNRRRFFRNLGVVVGGLLAFPKLMIQPLRGSIPSAPLDRLGFSPARVPDSMIIEVKNHRRYKFLVGSPVSFNSEGEIVPWVEKLSEDYPIGYVVDSGREKLLVNIWGRTIETGTENEL